jgi:predicted MFS family arabinose efflux permease
VGGAARARLVPAVLREEPRFRLLFLGQLFSLVGDRIMLVVLPFAVLSAGGDTGDVGLVAAAQTVPFLVLALAGGVIADRGDRRRVMIASDVVRMLVQALAAVLLLTGQARPWHLAACAAVYGSADAFFSPAMTGLLPQTLTHPDQLQAANALRSLTYSVGSVAGPSLAGVLLAVSEPGVPVAVDAATFAASIAFLWRLSPREADLVSAAESSDAPPASGFLAELRGGWRAMRSRDWIPWFLGGLAVYHVIVLPSVYVLGPVLAEDELGGPAAWAAISVAFGAGTIIGDLTLLRWRPAHALRAAALLFALASCQAVIFGSGLPLGLICALELVAALGVTMGFALWESSLGEHVPGAELSRVSSYDYLASAGLMPLGFLVAAPFAEAVGIHTALAIMSAVGVAASLALLSVRSVRTLGRGTA